MSWQPWEIEQVTTRGRGPGWISWHTATDDAAVRRIVVSSGKQSVRRRQPAGREPSSEAGRARQVHVEQYEGNTDTYALDLATGAWRRLRA